MVFKILVSLVLAATSVNAVAAPSNGRAAAAQERDASPEIRENLSQEIMELTKADEQIKSALEQGSQMMWTEMPAELKDRMQAVLEKFSSWDKLETKFAKIYADVFTAKELRNIIAFYKSDVGTNLIAKQPDLMNKTLTMIQEINNEMKPFFMEELKKHHETPASETPAAK